MITIHSYVIYRLISFRGQMSIRHVTPIGGLLYNFDMKTKLR